MKISVLPSLDTRRILANGKYPVKLRVYFNRADKRYDMGISLSKDEFDHLHTNKKLQPTWLKISSKIEKADKIIEFLDENFSFAEFEKRFFSPVQVAVKSDLNIINQINRYIEVLKNEGSIKTQEMYKATIRHLKDYLQSDSLSLEKVTIEFLKGFENYLRGRELASSTIGMDMRNIRRVFNIAISEKIISADLYPFGRNRYSPPASRKAKKALSLEDIKKLYDYEPIHPTEQWAKDMWFFSYSANGMNVKDIALLKYENIQGDEISFIREKTKNSTRSNQMVIQILMNDELKKIIAKQGNKKRLPKNYIFNILKEPTNQLQVFKDVNQAIKTINFHMKRIAQHLQLSRVPTTNFARHSFSTVLKRAGVSIEMISEQLGHSSIKTTQIYLDSFEKEQRKEIGKHLFAFKEN
ncbi:MAG: site-specific integrase [Tannerella sp.]|jgi:site-specific recombinase XerD|nr:site-specific integrase [Tannerella sp.]